MSKKTSWVAIWMGLFVFSVLTFFVTEAVFIKIGWRTSHDWGKDVFMSVFLTTFWIVIGRRAETR